MSKFSHKAALSSWPASIAASALRVLLACSAVAAVARAQAVNPENARPDAQGQAIGGRSPSSGEAAPKRTRFSIAVLGDTLAAEAAQGLAEAFKDRPEIAVSDLSHDLSGLTREDYFNWPKASLDLAKKGATDLAVVMLGINDTQTLTEGGAAYDLLSPGWRAAYGQRIEKVAAAFHNANIPVVWIGLPPMSDGKFNRQAAALNELYRTQVEAAGGLFVDVRDAFSDQNGQYVSFGPDADGQVTKLRGGPGGVYFTKAGARKLAQLLEPEVRRRSDKASLQPESVSLPPEIEPTDDLSEQILKEMGMSVRKTVRSTSETIGPVLQLTARPASPHGELIDPRKLGSPSASLVTGDPPPEGRADDFSRRP